MSLKISIKPVGLKELSPFDLEVEPNMLAKDLNQLISQKTGLGSQEFNLMVLGKTLSPDKSLGN